MEGKLDAVCMICGKCKMDGIRIVSAFLCDTCESELVCTDVSDVKYLFYVHQMKQIFYKMNA
jgi:hypothetical protein